MANVTKLAKELYKIWRGCGIIFLLQYIVCLYQNVGNVLKTRSLGIVDQCIEKKLAFINVKAFGYKFKLLSDSLPLIREIFLNNCYGFIPKKYGIVIDLGANRGVFSILAAKFSNKVYSVECNPKEFLNKFQIHLTVNGLNNVTFVGKFASNIDDQANISLNFLRQFYNIETIDFLKIDIEGGEEPLFSSNLQWLNKTRSLSMEIHPCFGVNWSYIIRTIENHGLTVKLLNKDLKEIRSFESVSIGYIWAERQ